MAEGLGDAPAVRPLDYPGRPAGEPVLLTGRQLLPLTPTPAARLGTWLTPAGRTLDDALGETVTGHRHPVIAVGSNASPAQLHHKLTEKRLPVTVPMVPVRIRGVGVGCSAHIGRNGYVAAAPYPDPGAELTLVISWLDGAQLRAVDGTEFNYRRVLLPGGPGGRFTMTMPSGEALGGAYVYVSAHGLLAPHGDGRPLPGGGDQRALLARLLAGSPALRELLGPGPESWVERARADEAVRQEGKRIFRELGWVLPVTSFPAPEEPGAVPRTYDGLPSLV
ncbi:hypothetical protein [Streptomyces sp. NPDC002537]